MDYNVFISHSSENEEQVKSICAYLEDKGLKCFFSKRDIPPGVSYPGAITRAMRESEMVLLIFSKESNESTQVDRELTLANDQKKKMSCFRLEDVAYSDDKAYLMSGVNWLDAFPTPEQHYFELLQDICRQLGREVPQQEETEEDKRERYESTLGYLISNASKGNSDAQYELGKAYFEGTYGLTIDAEEAFRWIMKAAKKGHIFAENHIGVCYATGIYVKKNDEEAIKWYRLSALHGNVVAQGNLGFKYYSGEGCKKDIAQAVKWWSLAADQGYDEAQKRLGDCYYSGLGVEVDYGKAVSLYEKAVAQDNDSAQIMLATCYREGKGVEKDIEKCINLLDIAAKNGSTDAMIELANLYESGEDIEENPEKAFYYVKMAADDKGDPFCMYHLSRYYHEGYGCEVDSNLWFEYLNKAANADQPNALDILGDIYLFGNEELNIQIDEQKAIQWYQKAVDQGYTMAMVDLALCYSPGGCLPLDDVKAVELLKSAAESGDDRGQFFLSERYQQGNGVEQNDVEAYNWCKKSAEQEFVSAMSKLGKYYFYGFGTEQNFEKAVEWFAKATWEGDDEAKYLWGLCYELGYGVEKSYGNAAVRYYFSAKQDNSIAKEAHDRLYNYLIKMSEEGDADSQYELGLYYMALDENMENNNLEYRNQSLEYTLKAAGQKHTKALNNAAWILHLLGRYEEALPWAEKAIETTPKDPNVVDTLATVYQGLGRYEDAIEQFHLCLKLKNEQNATEDEIAETKTKIAELKELMNKQQ